MTLHEILADIHALEEDLLAFERKYGIRSETFFVAYTSGEEPEEDTCLPFLNSCLKSWNQLHYMVL